MTFFIFLWVQVLLLPFPSFLLFLLFSFLPSSETASHVHLRSLEGAVSFHSRALAENACFCFKPKMSVLNGGNSFEFIIYNEQ